jgi:hypothetical protein
VVAATIIVVAALAAVSEIVLPLTFAVVLAVVFQPAVEILAHHRFRPTIAAGLVVVGLLALMTGVVVATVRGVTGQADRIGTSSWPCPYSPSLATLSPAFDPGASSSRSPTAPSRPYDTYSNDVGCSAQARPQPEIDIAATAHTCGAINSLGTGFTTYT